MPRLSPQASVLSPARWRRDLYLAVLVALVVVSLPFVTHRVYASDEVQYFAYLRSAWFDRDLDFTNEYTYFIDRYPDALAGFKTTNLDRVAPAGERLGTRTNLPRNFGPIGTAVLWVPFYAAGHLAALALHAVNAAVAVDGYSAPYIWAITTGSAVYASLALLLLYRLAQQVVSRFAAFWATLGLWLGSPVIFYSHGAPAYSHAASLFAVTIFLVVWHRTRPLAARRPWHWLALGLLAGLVTSVREQDGVVPAMVVGAEALLALAASRQWSVARERGEEQRSEGGAGPQSSILSPQSSPSATGYCLLLVAWAVAFTPQVLTYCALNGNCLPDNNVTQKLESGASLNVFNNAYLVALSPDYGLIFWTPLVVPALLGLAWLWRRDRTLALALLAVFLATWLVNAVYSTGPTRGSFGARRFLNCTPLFLLGLAAAYEALRARRLGALAMLLSLAGIWWNLGLVVQFALNLMDRQRLELGPILYNQVAVVPPRLLDIARQLVFARDSLFKN